MNERNPGEKTTIVQMGEWGEGHDGQILKIGNLGPCLGIGIYEPHSKMGFLLHEPHPQDTGGVYERFEDRLREVFASQPGAFSGMKAWLGGGSDVLARLLAGEVEEESRAYVSQNRKFAEEAMHDIGIPAESIEIHWTPDGFISASMTLDCTTGTCKTEYI